MQHAKVSYRLWKAILLEYHTCFDLLSFQNTTPEENVHDTVQKRLRRRPRKWTREATPTAYVPNNFTFHWRHCIVTFTAFSFGRHFLCCFKARCTHDELLVVNSHHSPPWEIRVCLSPLLLLSPFLLQTCLLHVKYLLIQEIVSQVFMYISYIVQVVILFKI